MESTSLAHIAEEMQNIAQNWEQLLYNTGGALVLEKCFFVAMDWDFSMTKQYNLKSATSIKWRST